MENLLFLDFETKSELDIKTVGGKKYARHCEPLLLAYALNDEQPLLWDWTISDELPQSLIDRLDKADWLVAHNASFDRTVFEDNVPYTNKPLRWMDTMVLAYAAGLPGSLADLCEYFGLPSDTAKDKDGKRLIKKFCTPQKASKKQADLALADDDWNRFCSYCLQDVVALRAVYDRLPKDNSTEELWADWDLDYQINEIGVPVDTELAGSALAACNEAAAAASARCQAITGGIAPSQTAALRDYLASQGLDLPDLTKATVEGALAGQIDAKTREVLECRQEATKTSTKKLQTILDAADDDGRIRGTLQFYGASHTGRWAGRLLQVQNLPRPTLADDAIDTAIDTFKSGAGYETYGKDTAATASSCLRACIAADCGQPFTICDYSSIENRVLAWYAGEQWKLDAFAAGRDLYVETYNRTFGANITKKDKKERQIGKIMELALGYQGSVGSFVNFAQMYGVDLTQLPVPPQRIADDAGYDAGFQGVLDRPTFFKIRQIVLGWRAAHPATRRFWNQVAYLYDSDRLKFLKDNNGLHIQLPSGRYLCYQQYDRSTQTCFGQIPGHVGYGRIRVGSNVLLNNIVQGTARDLLAHALRQCTAKGWQVLFHVHDEIVVQGCPSVEALQEVMCTLPDWAEGLPIAAAGEQSFHYTK